MVRDLPVLYAHHVDRFELNFAVCRGNSEEDFFVRSVVRPLAIAAGAVGCNLEDSFAASGAFRSAED